MLPLKWYAYTVTLHFSFAYSNSEPCHRVICCIKSSTATTLLLFAQVTFGRDLRCCPTFINLKTLVLKDGCLVADLHMLFCFLQYTPILEKLVLQLCKVDMPLKYDWFRLSGAIDARLIFQSILFAAETQSRSPNERLQSYGTVTYTQTT